MTHPPEGQKGSASARKLPRFWLAKGAISDASNGDLGPPRLVPTSVYDARTAPAGAVAPCARPAAGRSAPDPEAEGPAGAERDEGVREPCVGVSVVDGRDDPPLKLLDGNCSSGDRNEGGPRGRTPFGIGEATPPGEAAGRLEADW